MILHLLNIKPRKLLKLRFLHRGKNTILKSKDIDQKTKIGMSTTLLEGVVADAQTSIGNYCYIGKYTYLTKVTLGNYCSIANNVSIGQGEHDLSRISTNSIFYNDPYTILTSKPCKIGNDVWIGVDAIIQRGVTIGNGAVIGSNAVVTKDVPPYAVVIGSPARIHKYRFDSKKIEKIEKSRWWELTMNEAKKIFKELD